MTERAQVLGRADARDLQDVRRVHRAAAHDHLAVPAHRLGGAAAPDLDADAALALEQQAAGLRIGLDAQVRTAARLAQERLRRRAAPAPAPADDLRDWRTRAYAIWFCYVYENFLIIDKPAYSVEELILEFQSPDVLDTPGALLLDAYDIHPTYIHRGRKTERGCRVEHFVEAFNSRACKRAQEA